MTGEVPAQEAIATKTQLEDYISKIDDPTLITFGKVLAERLEDGLSPLGYINATEYLLYDLQVGVDGYSNEPMPNVISGLPIELYNAFRELAHGQFAQGAFGEEFSTQVESIWQEILTHSSQIN